MKTLALVFNIPSAYRESIYKLIDENWNCEWIFGENKTDIKCLNPNTLKKAYTTISFKIFGNFYWQKGIIKFAFNKNFDQYLLLGEPYNISIWLLCIFLRIFFPKKKIFFWTHGWYGKESRIKKLIKKTFFSLADKIFLYGEYAKKLMIKEGFNPDKLIVIHNSLDYDKQLELRNCCKPSDLYNDYFHNDFPVLIFIGRLTEVKKIDLLLHALKDLKDKGKTYNLVLVGGGIQEKNLKDLTKSLDLQNQVWFYGACYDETTNAELIYNADLCVSPGNVGLTAIHSLMFGTPVLTHDDFTWQMPEFETIIPDKTGNFFTYNDVTSLAESIKSWFENHKTDREHIRKECYQEIDSSWNPKFQLEIFKKILS